METLIKSENVPAFIKKHFPNHQEAEMRRDYGYMLNKDIIISNLGDWCPGKLAIEIESHPNDRCVLFEMFSYDLTVYDSVSLKGKLVEYATRVVPSQH